ncbi:MAG: GNAT family N-acetyltransferase [Eubacteriales bacterium]|nr:GNAT family N-acetyltransferase [Eubacteriales bacterium]
MNGMRVLITNHLVMKKETLDDVKTLYERLGQDPEQYSFTGKNPFATMESAEETVRRDIAGYEEEGKYVWLLTYSGDFAGRIETYDYDPENSSIEIEYSIDAKYRGQGLGKEVVCAVVSFMLNSEGIKHVNAWAAKDDQPSIKILEDAGLKVVKEEDARYIFSNPEDWKEE